MVVIGVVHKGRRRVAQVLHSLEVEELHRNQPLVALFCTRIHLVVQWVQLEVGKVQVHFHMDLALIVSEKVPLEVVHRVQDEEMFLVVVLLN